MADTSGYVTPIFFMIAAIAFISVFLLGATSTFNDYSGERIELNEDTTFTKGWEATGDNWEGLDGSIPPEAFDILIIPLILITGFIIIMVASALLPNWLSGG